MIVYNVTVSVDPIIDKEWLEWMRNHHIPDVMRTGFFISAELNKVITSKDDEITYAIAYRCNDIKDLHAYEVKCAPLLQKEHSDKFKDNTFAFRTIIQVIEKF